jgi:hypothetical protein
VFDLASSGTFYVQCAGQATYNYHGFFLVSAKITLAFDGNARMVGLWTPSTINYLNGNGMLSCLVCFVCL